MVLNPSPENGPFICGKWSIYLWGVVWGEPGKMLSLLQTGGRPREKCFSSCKPGVGVGVVSKTIVSLVQTMVLPSVPFPPWRALSGKNAFPAAEKWFGVYRCNPGLRIHGFPEMEGNHLFPCVSDTGPEPAWPLVGQAGSGKPFTIYLWEWFIYSWEWFIYLWK